MNLASRLEGANRTYGTRALISEGTTRLAADAVETREIDSVLVVGKTEPQRISSCSACQRHCTGLVTGIGIERGRWAG